MTRYRLAAVMFRPDTVAAIQDAITDDQLALLFSDTATMLPLLDEASGWVFTGAAIRSTRQDFADMFARAIPMLASYNVDVISYGSVYGHLNGVVSSADTGGQNGIKSAQWDIANNIAALEAYGAAPAGTFLDLPFLRVIDQGLNTANGVNMTPAEAAVEMSAYISTMRAYDPDHWVIIAENVVGDWPFDGATSYSGGDSPNRPDFRDVWDAFVTRATADGTLAGCRFVIQDGPVEQVLRQLPAARMAQDDWLARCMALQAMVTADGVGYGQEFLSIYGGDDSWDAYHDAPYASDDLWNAQVLDFMSRYVQHQGIYAPSIGLPDLISPAHSYMTHPSVLVPSSVTSVSQTWMANLRRYTPPARTTAAARSDVARSTVARSLAARRLSRLDERTSTLPFTIAGAGTAPRTSAGAPVARSAPVSPAPRPVASSR